MPIYPGKMLIYRWRAGQVRAGQTESAAMVTKVNPNGTLNLKVFPDDPNGDLWFKNVPQLSDAIQTHCWTFTPDDRETENKPPQLRFDPQKRRVTA